MQFCQKKLLLPGKITIPPKRPSGLLSVLDEGVCADALAETGARVSVVSA